MTDEARIREAVEATHKKLLQLLTSSSWSMPPEKVHVILRDAFRDLLTEAEEPWRLKYEASQEALAEALTELREAREENETVPCPEGCVNGVKYDPEAGEGLCCPGECVNGRIRRELAGVIWALSVIKESQRLQDDYEPGIMRVEEEMHEKWGGVT